MGVFLGLVMSQGEVISWYRIHEMFRFDSFHMFGIIGTAVLTGIIALQIIKRRKLHDIDGRTIEIPDKSMSIPRYLIGGSLFGLGWAIVGVCPAPMFILVGQGNFSIIWVILGAIIGTFFYGILRPKLPH